MCQQAGEGSSEWAPGSTYNISVSPQNISFVMPMEQLQMTRWLCLSLRLDALPTELEVQLAYPLQGAHQRLQLSTCCRTGQRGSYASLWYCECSLACQGWMSMSVWAQPSSSPVIVPLQMLIFSLSSLLEQRVGV